MGLGYKEKIEKVIEEAAEAGQRRVLNPYDASESEILHLIRECSDIDFHDDSPLAKIALTTFRNAWDTRSVHMGSQQGWKVSKAYLGIEKGS